MEYLSFSQLAVFSLRNPPSYSRLKSFPFKRSSSISPATVFGSRMPNLWVVFQQRDFTFDIIRFLFLNTTLDHHARADSSLMLFATAYSATCTGCDAFISLRAIHSADPYCHSTRKEYPRVVIFRRFPALVSIHSSPFLMAVSSDQWSLISMMSWYCLPSESYC